MREPTPFLAPLEKQRTFPKFYQIICVLIVDLLTFLSGALTTWSSPIIEKLLKLEETPLGRKLTVSEISWIGSLFPLGATFGPFLSAYSAQKFGKKPTMIAIASIFVAALITQVSANNIHMIYAGRAISGISHGSVFTVIPLYLAEIAKDTNRGIIGNSAGLSALIGCFFSYAIGPYVSYVIFNVMCLIIPCAFLVLSFIIPESPHYLIIQEKEVKAQVVYSKLDIGDAKSFHALCDFVKSKKTLGLKEIFRSKVYLKPFFIVLMISLFKQLTGASTIATYTQYIFEQTGNTVPSEICSIIVGAIESLGGVFAPLVVDKYGRRIMLIVSTTILIITLFFVGLYFNNLRDIPSLSWIPIVCLVIFKFFYGFGIVSTSWILLAEMLPSKIKSQSSAVVNSLYWLMQFALTNAFPLLASALGMGIPFWIYCGFNIFALVFIIVVLPETKGKSAAEIEALFKDGDKKTVEDGVKHVEELFKITKQIAVK